MKALIVNRDVEILHSLSEILSELGYSIDVAQSVDQAERKIASDLQFIFFDPKYPESPQDQRMLAWIKRATSANWIMIGDMHPDNADKLYRLGVIDSLQPPLSTSVVRALLAKIRERHANPALEIAELVGKIAGIQLSKEKRLLVETRLMRRASQLGLKPGNEYFAHYKKHRDAEINELVSVMTTHTTEFFREMAHFDHLFDVLLPVLKKQGGPINIWSAACSTGEEVYSLAIAVLEFFADRGITGNQLPEIQIIGTDIDHNAVKTAQEGIYPKKSVLALNPRLVKNYFDLGTGEIAEFCRVKDHLHRLCQFSQCNLLAPNYPFTKFDAIFVRNVFIYFGRTQIESICQKLRSHLTDQGRLYVGHSESLMGLQVPFKSAGMAIYAPGDASTETSEVATVIPLPAKKRSGPARVLIVDDSKTIRTMLREILSKDHGFEIAGEAEDPIEADKILATTEVDVMTLDIHMPRMDGITYLEKMRGKPHPPVVLISSISSEDAINVFKVFTLDAVDYIEKPRGLDLETEADRIRMVVAAAVQSKRVPLSARRAAANSKSAAISYEDTGQRDLIAIGASTGGVEAIKSVVSAFPKNSPPVLIVQHIPATFSKAFAEQLNSLCIVKVHEAIDGEEVSPGYIYVAPGGKQMSVTQDGHRLRIQLADDSPLHKNKPSVDYLFKSLAKLSRYRVSAALLTGMGADGAEGLRLLRDMGAHTIAQNEETCVVFGMPKEAIRLGGAKEVLPLPSIGYHLFNPFKPRKIA